MGIIGTKNKKVLAYKGLHLYHAGLSNCSMRVRMTLIEKGLDWTSHHLDLPKREHITDEYFSINPNGVVPTLVHDGQVIIESDDIIDYIDQTFATPALRPENEEDLKEMYQWMKKAVEVHVKALKTYIYTKKMRGKMRMSEEQEKEYKRLQKNEVLLAFHEKSSSKEGFSDQELNNAVNILDQIFIKADERLKDHEYLVGSDFSLADIAWIPLYYTLENSGYPFDSYEHVQGWATRIKERESYKQGVLKWCPNF